MAGRSPSSASSRRPAARANSDRPEQGAWWSETEKYYDGASLLRGVVGCHRAHGRRVERRRVRPGDEGGGRRPRPRSTVSTTSFEQLASVRPDLLGRPPCVDRRRSVRRAAYFTSEAEARAGEQKELPEEVQALMAEFQEIMANTEFIDLIDPELH